MSKITNITITLSSGTTISTTLEEAEELYNELKTIFGTKDIGITFPNYPIYPGTSRWRGGVSCKGTPNKTDPSTYTGA